MKKRTKIGAFIHSSWTNMNIRAGKYRHLQTKNKCKNYENIIIEFNLNEYKEWCLKREKYILSLERPSLDRINSLKNYKLENIQIIELKQNISKKKPGNNYLNGPLSNKKRGVRKIKNKFSARITFNNKERHLGMFKSKDDAYTCFYNEYFNYYGKYPW